MSERFKFKITKFDRGMYTAAVVIYTFMSGIILLFEANITWSGTSSLARFFLILIPIILGVLTFLYLSLYIREVDLKDDNMKEDPDDGYKFITFDFNKGRQYDELKNSVKYQISIGSKVSDAVYYLNKTHPLKEIKKDGEKFFCWSDNCDSQKWYSDEVITKGYNNKTLYAQYSNKKNKERWILPIYLCASILAVLIFSVLFWCIEDYKADPANKVVYEVVPYGKDDSKVIVGHYNGDAILMDYTLKVIDKSREKEIHLIKGEFYIDSVKGKKIKLERYKTAKDKDD